MTDKEVNEKIAQFRRDICKIAALEAHYWLDADNRLENISLGAHAAAANICVAILTEKTPEQYEKELSSRDQNPLTSTPREDKNANSARTSA